MKNKLKSKHRLKLEPLGDVPHHYQTTAPALADLPRARQSQAEPGGVLPGVSRFGGRCPWTSPPSQAQRPPWPAIASPKPANGSAAAAPREGVPAPKPPSPLPVRVGQGDLRGNSGSLPRASPPRLLQKTRPPAWRTPASPAWASRGVFVPTGAGCDFLSPSSHPRLIFLPHTLSERIGPKKINKGEKKIATLY